MAARGMRYCWNWFASCHGKTDECDAGGGAFKRTLDGIELAGKGFFDGAKEIVQRSRKSLTKPNANNNDPAEAWYWNASSERDGSGVYRRWYHHIPVRGPAELFDSVPGSGCDSGTIRQWVGVGVYAYPSQAE